VAKKITKPMRKNISGTKKYRCVFFDLDHTLWDYETNSKETLIELYSAYDLESRGVTDIEMFYQQFRIVNLNLWNLYDNGLIDNRVIRKERFKQILEYFNAYDERLSDTLSVEYLNHCPRKGKLMPYALEVLEYLSAEYNLTVVTNGFEEIQHTKLNASNLNRFFDHIVTSQKAGHKKPSRQIFEYAMTANGIQCSDAIMIGDNLSTDIGGARNAAIDAVYFNPEKVAHTSIVNHEITCLSELQKIL
jgi:YjjG family noncanonical pyrimidine nucleotidase